MPDWAGKTLGDVDINRLVARGGMAEVYVGHHDSIGEVAVKVMRGLLDRDSDQLARFQREAEVIADLRHPNIVQMHYYEIVNESPYLVMEYVPGPSLAAYLKSLHDNNQRLPIGMVAQILNAIASALDYAHERGVIHRDIKPANVLLRSKDGEVKLNEPLPLDVEPVLTDFGLVRLLDSTMHTTAGSVSGTPTYMSPEQARGEKVDKRTDIYSLGIMLYEMLAGTVPFQADTTFGMLMKHINEPLPPIPGISLELQAILDRTLAKDPALRYESAGDLAKEFYALFNGQTISPGTIHLAQLAREAIESGNAGTPRKNQPSMNRWLRIGLEGLLVIGLALVLVQFFRPGTTSVELTPGSLDPNTPVGKMDISSVNNINDKARITLNNIPQPEAGTQLKAWLVSDDGNTFLPLGSITLNAAGGGSLEYTDPNEENLFKYSQLQISSEQEGETSSRPAGEIVYSSVFPPQALEYVRNIELSYADVPNQISLMEGLYYYSGSYVNTPINGNINDPTYVSMMLAYEKEDEQTFRKDLEMLINTLVGMESDLYKDYNQDDLVETYYADGYGSLPNGDQAGYLNLTDQQVKLAHDAPDATQNIRRQSQNIQACIENMQNWTDQILPLALALTDMPFGPEMKGTLDELSKLGDALLDGVDQNKSGTIEPVVGECGAEKAYEYGWDLADFIIYPGADRVPPPAE